MLHSALLGREDDATGLIVKRINVELQGFPSASPSLTIAHLSDFHLGPFVRERQVRKAVEAANREAPDLIALTGDYVTEGEAFIRRIGNLLAPLRAPLGVYAVLGNHDHLANGGGVSTALAGAGIEVLHNQSRLLEWPPRAALNAHPTRGRRANSLERPNVPPTQSPRGCLSEAEGPIKFAVVGVDDPQRAKADVAKAMQDVPEALPALVLSHNPDVLYPLQGRPATLIFSGHTHGGQVFRLGRHLLQATRFGKQHPYGLHRLGSAQIYITSGIGTTFLPIRLFCPAEVAILHIAGPRRDSPQDGQP